MHVSGPAAARAYRQFASEMGIGAGGESGHLLVSQMNPLNLLACANRIRDSIERIAADTVNSFDSCFHQNINKQVSYSFCHAFFPFPNNLSFELAEHQPGANEAPNVLLVEQTHSRYSTGCFESNG